MLCINDCIDVQPSHLSNALTIGWISSIPFKFEFLIWTLCYNLDGEPEYGAEIQAHPNGKWLYVSNRGTGPMLLYYIDQETGLLTSKPVRI